MVFARPWVRWTLVAVSVVAAVSVGGGFVAGIVLGPMLIVASRHVGPLAAACFILLAGVLLAEVAWAMVYVVLGESQPAIWLGPIVAGVGTIATGGWARFGQDASRVEVSGG